MAASKPTLRQRLTPGKMSGWLPAVAVFLCLMMFAIAALVLFQAGTEPRSPQSAAPTAVAAQGFAGLRRLLDAEGYTTVLNRFETGHRAVEHGDLEIITLDATGGFALSPPVRGPRSDREGGDASASADSAASPPQPVSDVPGTLADGFAPWPSQSDHILYKPLGRAVLVVAPKWTASPDRKNPLWATDPHLVSKGSIRAMLLEISPMTEVPARYDDEGEVIPPEVAPGQGAYNTGEKIVIFDKVPYDIQRGGPAKGIVLKRLGGGEGLAVGDIDSLQSITGPNLTPVLVGPGGEVVLSRINVTGGRKATAVPVYLLSDPDLLNNQILSDPRRVEAALNLIDELTPAATAPATSRKVIFNLTFNGLSLDRDLLHALSQPPFVAVPLALLILGLALMWAAFTRFGPAQAAAAGAPLGRGIRTLADNAARLMAITGKAPKLGPAYAILVRDQVIRSKGFMQVDPSQSLDALAERIGTTHGATDSYLKLKDRAAQVANVHQLIDVTLKLHAWKTEIERAHI